MIDRQRGGSACLSAAQASQTAGNVETSRYSRDRRLVVLIPAQGHPPVDQPEHTRRTTAKNERKNLGLIENGGKMWAQYPDLSRGWGGTV